MRRKEIQLLEDKIRINKKIRKYLIRRKTENIIFNLMQCLDRIPWLQSPAPGDHNEREKQEDFLIMNPRSLHLLPLHPDQTLRKKRN